MMKKILVTGAAGFIGFHLANRLLIQGYEVVGLDTINDYYDVGLKYGRLAASGIEKEEISKDNFTQSKTHPNYRFIQLALENREALHQLFASEKFDGVVNLAAQPGVRYSLINPYAYIDSNIVGFINLLEACRHYQIKHLVYASSSSVYGLNSAIPYSTKDNVDHPISLYAATKKSNELMAHTYSHLYNIPVTGLRFFTVYGPWGRPDMAIFLFTKAIFNEDPIKVFNHGKMMRDFTYVDDIVEGIFRVLQNPPKPNIQWNQQIPDPSSSSAPYKVYNIGNNHPVQLLDFIEAIETAVGKKAIKKMMPIQPGDVTATYADVEEFVTDFDYQPSTSVTEGVQYFVDWYRVYYGIK
ncbi:MAG: NAD-dependent epimerase [Bacteroidota bacterium]